MTAMQSHSKYYTQEQLQAAGRCSKHPQYYKLNCLLCFKEKNKARIDKAIAEEKIRKLPDIMKNFKVPLLFQDCDIAKLLPKRAEKIMDLINNNTFQLLTLLGKPGTGKTTTAVVILQQLYLKKNVNSAMFYPAVAIFHDLIVGYKNDTADDFMRSLITTDWLVIDDMGAERTNDWAKTQFYYLLTMRINNMKPTIFTTNLTINELSDAYDPRIASRLGSGVVLNFNTVKDMRKGKK